MHKLPLKLLNALGASSSPIILDLDGNENDNYLVKFSGASYVVRRLKSHSAASTESEALYCQFLAEQGLPVMPFVQLSAESHVLSVDGTHYIATRYSEGEVPETLTTEIAEQAGRILAKTHSLYPTSLPQRYTWYTKTYIRDATKDLAEEFAETKRIFLELDTSKIDFWQSGVPQTIVHGDFHRQNIIVDQHNVITRVLDWEEACLGPAILDLGYAIRALSFSDGQCNKQRYSAFLKGYQEVRTLTPLELSLMAPAMQYTTLLLSVWAHLKFSRDQMSRELLDDLGQMYKTTYITPQ